MANYISCIEATGGNKEQIKEEVSKSSGTCADIGAKIDVRAPRISDGGALILDGKLEESIARSRDHKWFPSASSDCLKVMSEGQAVKKSSSHTPETGVQFFVDLKTETSKELSHSRAYQVQYEKKVNSNGIEIYYVTDRSASYLKRVSPYGPYFNLPRVGLDIKVINNTNQSIFLTGGVWHA